jgi:hypothetical protein
MYRAMGSIHARLHTTAEALARRTGGARAGGRPAEAGQGTVEYVALILLVALVMAGVVAGLQRFQTDEGSQLAEVILGKIREAVRRVAF